MAGIQNPCMFLFSQVILGYQLPTPLWHRGQCSTLIDVTASVHAHTVPCGKSSEAAVCMVTTSQACLSHAVLFLIFFVLVM